jgi:hypothetical protein
MKKTRFPDGTYHKRECTNKKEPNKERGDEEMK